MKILPESRSYFANIGLGIDRAVQINGRSIPRILLRFVIVSALALTIILSAILCANGFDRGFAAILFPFYVILTYLSAIIVYTSLDEKKIDQLLNYLQHVVETSTCAYFFYRFSKWLRIYAPLIWFSMLNLRTNWLFLFIFQRSAHISHIGRYLLRTK